MKSGAVFVSLALLIPFAAPFTGMAQGLSAAPIVRQIGPGDLAGAASGSDWGVKGFLDLELDVFSMYVWRGRILADKMCVQPSLTYGSRGIGLSLNIWGSAAIKDRDVLKRSDEIDLTLSFDRSFGSRGMSLGGSLGYIQRLLPNLTGAKHSEEVFCGFSLNTQISPGVAVFYDFGLDDAFYIAVEIGPEISLDSKGNVKFSTRASVGFSDRTGSFKFSDLSGAASVDIRRGSLIVRPTSGISYVDDPVNRKKAEFWGGMAVSFSR